jgi:hypothetical protein
LIEPEDKKRQLLQKAKDELLSLLATGEIVKVPPGMKLKCHVVDCNCNAITIRGVKVRNEATGLDEWQPFYGCEKHQGPPEQYPFEEGGE